MRGCRVGGRFLAGAWIAVGLCSMPCGRSARAADNPRSDTVVREIDDLSTGNRWLLVRNSEHTGGPGRMVLVAGPGMAGLEVNGSGPGGPGTDGRNLALEAVSVPKRQAIPDLRPVIRGGDRLVVEQNTPVIVAWLDGIALGPAATGGRLKVRLTATGGVVQAVALGAGRAALDTEGGL